MPVAELVDLLHRGAQPGDGLAAFGGCELPPRWRRAGTVPVGVGVGRSRLGELGQGGRVLAQRVADAGDEVGELAEPLVVVGELLQRGGDRVGGHGQLQGRKVPSPGQPFGGHVVGDADPAGEGTAGTRWSRRAPLEAGRGGGPAGRRVCTHGKRAMTVNSRDGRPGRTGGSRRIMSGVATSRRVAWSWRAPSTTPPLHSSAAALSVVVSVIPGRNTFTEPGVEDDLAGDRPRSRSAGASPWTYGDHLARPYRRSPTARRAAELGKPG